MPDETRVALRRAAVLHNVDVLDRAPGIDQIELAALVDVQGVLDRYDAGQPIKESSDEVRT
jgi:hypothetical protein